MLSFKNESREDKSFIDEFDALLYSKVRTEAGSSMIKTAKERLDALLADKLNLELGITAARSEGLGALNIRFCHDPAGPLAARYLDKKNDIEIRTLLRSGKLERKTAEEKNGGRLNLVDSSNAVMGFKQVTQSAAEAEIAAKQAEQEAEKLAEEAAKKLAEVKNQRAKLRSEMSEMRHSGLAHTVANSFHNRASVAQVRNEMENEIARISEEHHADLIVLTSQFSDLEDEIDEINQQNVSRLSQLEDETVELAELTAALSQLMSEKNDLEMKFKAKSLSLSQRQSALDAESANIISTENENEAVTETLQKNMEASGRRCQEALKRQKAAEARAQTARAALQEIEKSFLLAQQAN
jgi:DNA repair exonuclease SbcCD ATPase subunit